MRITRDRLSSLTIRQVGGDSIRVGDVLLKESFAIVGDRILSDWRTGSLEELSEDDLAALIAGEPEMILLGTGRKAVFPPRELLFALARRGIGLETMDTAAACRTFNVLLADGRKVAAVFLI